MAARHTPEAQEAIKVLGQQIKEGRRRKGWTADNLAKRVGVSSRTITSIEGGATGTSIGTVLTAATLVGVHLFGADRFELMALRRRGEERQALLPSRVFPKEYDDVVPDF